MQFLRITGLASVLSLTWATAGSAALLSGGNIATWQGGSGNWIDSHWTVNGVADQTNPGSAQPNNITNISSGTVSRSSAISFGGNHTWNLSGTGGLTAAAEWQVYWETINLSDTFSLAGTYIRLNNKQPAGNSSKVTMSGGSITMSSSDAFRLNTFNIPTTDGAWFNLTGDAGSTFISQTDNTVSGTTLTDRVNAGYFRIDGTQVFGTGISNAVNDKYFSIATDSGTQTLAIMAVPEPSSFALAAAGALLVLPRRRTS